MSSNFRTFSFALAAVLVFLVSVPARADVVLTDANGSKTLDFDTGQTTNNYYSFNQTYSLDDPDSFFTSFVLNPQDVFVQFQSHITNFGPLFTFPAVDASDAYDGTFRWTGEVQVNGTSFSFGPYSTSVSGVDYDPDFISEGPPPGFIFSQIFSVSDLWDNASALSLNEEELGGVNSITVSIILSNMEFSTNVPLDKDTSKGWIGSIDGSFGVTWTSGTNATPEPATMMIFGIGIAGALVARRMRKK